MTIDPSTLSKQVPPHGPLQCRIALVGEAPGKDEDVNGIPFVGASGELLNTILGQAGINRRITRKYENGRITLQVSTTVYTTNVVKEYPGKEFDKAYYLDRKGTPSPLLLAYIEMLKRELQMCSANVIVAIGEHALRALTGKYGITKWRGSILESSLLPGRKVIPMIHPASVLREWSQKMYCVLDAKRIAEEANTPSIIRPVRNYIIRPTIDQVIEAEARFLQAEWCSFDIETKYNNIACIGFSETPQDAICIPFVSEGRHYWPNAEIEARAWKAVYNILKAPSKKVGQNLLFDLSHLRCHGMNVSNIFHDTMYSQNILYPELEKSLAILTSIYTKEPYYKSEGRAALKTKSEKAWDPRQKDETLWVYNCRDCAVTLEVAFAQIEDFAEHVAEM